MTTHLFNLFRATHGSPEHPIYHPEGSLNRHILLVALRALLGSGDRDLVLAALFHDLHKPSAGQTVTLEDGGSYWSNPDHASMAAHDDDIMYAVRCLGGDVDTVRALIRMHMAVKEAIPRSARLIPHIDAFRVFDDMVGRHPFPSRVGDFTLPGGRTLVGKTLPGGRTLVGKTLHFVGQSPIQQRAGADEFTVTINRHPHTFRFADAPAFFTGRFADLRWAAEWLLD